MPDPSPDTGAPAPSSPDTSSPQVDIGLGPDVSLYPEHLRPAPEPAAPPESDAPEPVEASAPETESDVAGAAPPSDKDGETRGTRRQRGDDAYQRGLAEGRATLEREQAERQQQDQFRQTQREANQDRARQGILQLYTGNRQAQALMQSTRQQILQEMAADFLNLGTDLGVDQDAYQTLHSASSAAELAKRAFDLGKKSRDEQVARLEAELQGTRGRLVGSRATPEATNGAGAPNLNGLSVDDYLAMSPKDAAKLSSAQIDAITAQLQADFANGRTQG